MMYKLLFILSLLAILGAIFNLRKGQDTFLQNLTPVSFLNYKECTNKVQFSTLSCPTSSGAQEVYDIFNKETTQSDSPACTQFMHYISSEDLKVTDFINQNNYYYDCFINESIRDLANTNECFFKKFYAPIILICGNFNIYAYPPYAKFDINKQN